MSHQGLEELQQKDFRIDYRLQALMTLVPKTRGKVLDIGSGNGEMAISLCRQAEIVYATDNSDILLKRLKEKSKKIPNLNVKGIDAENFDLREKNFNLITACDIAEHLKQDVNFFKNCHCHLIKGGKLFVSVPAIKFLYGIRDKKLGHCRRYNRDEIINKIQQAGFIILKCQYWNFLGFLPYFICEKILKKELVGPSRFQRNSLFDRFLINFFYLWLFLESKIKFLPIGLSLIILAKKSGLSG